MIKRVLYFGNPAYLSLNNAQMVIRLPSIKTLGVVSEKDGDITTRTVPIEDIGFVFIDHQQVTLTQALINALVENNTALVSCDSRHMPTGLMLPLDSNTLQSERYLAQINSSVPLRKQLWQQTVKAKIANQASVLKSYTNAQTGNMDVWAEDVRSDDSMNLEARAATYYWKSIFDFNPKFKRSQDGENPNALLNYGYAVLRAIVARSLVGSGLLPTLGIHHHNKYNAYCLADDIMEPYRPFVDVVVLGILDRHGADATLTPEVKRELLTIPVVDVMIGRTRCPLMVGVTHTTTSLLKCYEGSLKKIVYPTLP